MGIGESDGCRVQRWDPWSHCFGLVTLRLAFAALGAEAVADLADDFDQQVDFGRRVVEVEAGPGAGGDAEAVVERPRAMVAGADGDALLVEQLGDVVRVGLVEREAHEAGAVLGRRAEDLQAVDFAESFVGVASRVRVRGGRLFRCR